MPLLQLHSTPNMSTATWFAEDLLLKPSNAANAPSQKDVCSKPRGTIPHLSQYSSTTPNPYLSPAGIRYHDVLMATLPVSKGTSPRSNTLTNIQAPTTPSTGKIAITHVLLNSNQAKQNRQTTESWRKNPTLQHTYPNSQRPLNAFSPHPTL